MPPEKTSVEEAGISDLSQVNSIPVESAETSKIESSEAPKPKTESDDSKPGFTNKEQGMLT